jgi:hypothetical protein
MPKTCNCTIEFLKKLAKEFPNDYDLGQKIRSIINESDKEKGVDPTK